ncbi:MAG: DUF2817 domain-containing protein [Myxococcales bacterium]|nr:DUF2817 domain-containing protein [Myxococcales bacterium]
MNDQRFTDTWQQSKAAFIQAADSHPFAGGRGAFEIQPGYTLDYAWTGPADAERALVYSCGLHGIEGYAGGAVQRELLSHGENIRVLWLHSLNPWGMAHGRRVNEDNVDLNRNFLPEDSAFSADDAPYHRLEHLLNPVHIPRFEPYLLKVGFHIALKGLPTLRNAIARGQYSRPKGIFYGGSKRCQTTETMGRDVMALLDGVERVVWIDLHTGRGAKGDVVGFIDGQPNDTQRARIEQAFGDMLHAWEPGSELGYEMRGGMLPELAGRFGPARFDALTVEFGTGKDVAILRALRAENWLAHHGPQHLRGGKAPADHPVRRLMREAFNPDSDAWRKGVIAHGRSIHERACKLLQAD